MFCQAWLESPNQIESVRQNCAIAHEFPQPFEVADHGPKDAFAESRAKAKKRLPPVQLAAGL
jgi:hypothetical protein